MMFAIGIRYLMGRCVAADYVDRSRPEWPPHPDRMFMALASAFFTHDQSKDEREALEWLESLEPPSLCFSKAMKRLGSKSSDSVNVFVPVNDSPEPSNRTRQPRRFPAVIPERDTVYMIWEGAEANGQKNSLDKLCDRVTYLGHSSSPVHMWVEDAPPQPTHMPTSGSAPLRLRIPWPGKLNDLKEMYERQRRPVPRAWVGYIKCEKEEPKPAPRGGVFRNEIMVLSRRKGTRFPLESTLQLTEALRGAVMKHCQQPPPEWISGHQPDGRKSTHPHMSFIPLPDVGHAHADGHLMGVGLVLPQEIGEEDVQKILRPLLFSSETGETKDIRLALGRLGEWTIQQEFRDAPPKALSELTWTRPSRCWASVTPIVLDRHPKAEGQAEAIVALACERIGLPRPEIVLLSPVSMLEGAPHAKSFPSLPNKFGRSRGHHVHALITFQEKVQGPVLLGAGRFKGYGLCRPMSAMEVL